MTWIARGLAFLVSAVLGFAVASVALAALADRAPTSTAGTAPEYLLAGADAPAAGEAPVVVAFNEEPSTEEAVAIASLSPEDLSAAAAAILGAGDDGAPAEPAVFRDPTGFPRIKAVTQFDGGPFQGANCTLASGSMLARLAFGIVTNGSVLRTLQDDQDGGTGLNDLATALWRGYGVEAPYGLLRPQQLKDLLAAGYGAVIQGVYGEIPTGLRLQRDFTGGHAIYLDGYYPGNAKRGIPEAYYVIDPLGRPRGGYQGEWWPASVVDAFGTAFGGGRIPAMWAFPPGGVPPEVVGPDVLPIPDDPEPPDPDNTPDPSATAPPSGEPGATPVPVPSGFLPVEPGDIATGVGTEAAPAGDGELGGIIVVPVFDICLVNPSLPGCPTGLEAVFPAGDPPILQLPPGPDVEVVFVDSDRANTAIVGFTVDPPAPATVKYWVQGESPSTVGSAASLASIDLFGTTVLLAELPVRAGTTYAFQAVAGSGILAGTSEVGTFTTGSGVTAFSVSLGPVATPVLGAGTGLSPYSHLAPGSLLAPMVRLADLGGSACAGEAVFGGTPYCLDTIDLDVVPPAGCTAATVTYALAGITAESVTVRAYPDTEGLLPDGTPTLDGVLEATGPAEGGSVSVGCLASGLTYQVVLDAVGDDRGALAAETVTVP